MCSILIVDDEPSVLFGIKSFMANSGFNVEFASDLVGAKDILDRETVDVMITDLNLEGERRGDGFLLLKYAKKSYPHTVVIVMTGYGGHGTETAAIQMGADAYIEKPVDLDFLAKTVKILAYGKSRLSSREKVGAFSLKRSTDWR